MNLASPITIALVDDYPPIRKFLGSFLSDHGFTICYQAENGQHLLDQLGTGNVIPELCLLDVTMPVMDGYETARQLKEKYPEVQILAYSCFDDEKRIDKILEAGAHKFISKDSAPDEVRDALIELQLNAYSTSDAGLYLGQLN